MHSVTKQAVIPITTPPMNDPPIAADPFATSAATSDFCVRFWQTSTVAGTSLEGHWVINLKC